MHTILTMEQQKTPHEKKIDRVFSTLHYQAQQPLSGSKIRKQKLSFMGSASQFFTNQKRPVEEIVRQIGSINQDASLSVDEQYLRYERFLHLFYPTKPVTKEDEHQKSKTTFELLETLLILYRHVVKELPENRGYSIETLKNCEQRIYADKNNYYLRYYYLEGIRLKAYAKSLFSHAGLQDNEFKKLLLLNTAADKFSSSAYFFNKMLHLSDQDDNDNRKLQISAQKKNKIVQSFLQEIKQNVSKTDAYDSFKKIIHEAKEKKKRAKELFDQACKASYKIEKKSKKEIIFPKKPKKEAQTKLRMEISVMTAQLKQQLENMHYKGEIEQKIHDLHNQFSKKKYQNVSLKIHEFKIAQLKEHVLQDFDLAEDGYLTTLDLYLKAFCFNPKRRYINKAKKILDIIADIGSKKIQCNVNSFTIKDIIISYNKKIIQSEILLKNAEICNDTSLLLKMVESCGYPWML